MGLGRMDNLNKEQLKRFIHRLNEMLKGETGLFIAVEDPEIEAYTVSIFSFLIDNGKIDIQEVISGRRDKDKLK